MYNFAAELDTEPKQKKREGIFVANKWTEEQLSAIQSKNENLLLSAAAGSGKTAVLVERIIKNDII